MAFDVGGGQFQGPSVNVSLFGEAAKTGAALGEAIPTFLTSAIKGTEEGIKTGLTDIGLNQQNEIRQNEINQEPTQNAQQEEALRQAKQINDIRQTAVQADALTKDTQLQTAQQTADFNLNAAKEANINAKNEDEINKSLASGDPAMLGKIFSDPSFLGTLEKNPALADKVSRTVRNAPNVSPEDKQKAFAFADLAKETAYKAATARLLAAEKKTELDKTYSKNLSTATGIIGAATGSADISSLALNEDAILGYHTAKNGYFPLKVDAQGRQTINRGLPVNTKSDVTIPGIVMTEPYQLFRGDSLVGNTTAANAEKLTAAQAGLVERRRMSGVTTPSALPATPPARQNTEPESHVPTFENPNAPSTPGASPTPGGQVSAPPAPPGQTQEAWTQMYNQQIQAQASARDQKAKTAPISPSKSILDNARARQKAINSGATLPQNVPSNETVGSKTPISLDLNTTLSNAYGAKVVLASDSGSEGQFQFPPQIHKTVERINSNPLLSGAPIVIKGMAAVESAGKPNAISPTGVKGLLQVTKSTARMYGLNRDDPKENVLAGTLYLTDLMSKYNGNLRYALTAYNVGPGTMSDAIKTADSNSWEDIQAALKDLVRPAKYEEVKDYADRVIAHTTLFMNENPKQKGSFLWATKQSGALKSL